MKKPFIRIELGTTHQDECEETVTRIDQSLVYAIDNPRHAEAALNHLTGFMQTYGGMVQEATKRNLFTVTLEGAFDPNECSIDIWRGECINVDDHGIHEFSFMSHWIHRRYEEAGVQKSGWTFVPCQVEMLVPMHRIVTMVSIKSLDDPI